MKQRLVENLRAYIIKHGDRDDYRAFNLALKTYGCISLYSYTDASEPESGLIYAAFSDNAKEGPFKSNWEVYDICITNNEGIQYYAYSDLAFHFQGTRLIVPTNEVQPIFVEKISWDHILNAPKIESGDWHDLSYVVFEHMNLDSAPYDAEWECVKYLEKQTDITLDVVYNNCTEFDRPKQVQKTMLIRHCGNVVGVISITGRRSSGFTQSFAFNHAELVSVLDKIILESGLDKYRPPSTIRTLDMNEDCDAYFPVPGITPYIEDDYS